MDWHRAKMLKRCKMAEKTIREAVAVFHDAESLRNAADELMLHGFDRSDLSLLAPHREVERKLGHMYDKVSDIEDEPRVATQAYIGTDSITEGKAFAVGGLFFVGAVSAMGAIVASGGTIAAALIGAATVGGAGGVIGALLARFLGKNQADLLNDQIEHGGILLWVHTKDEEHEKRAVEILSKTSAIDVHVHDMPAVKDMGAIYGYLDWLAGVPKPKDKPAEA